MRRLIWAGAAAIALGATSGCDDTLCERGAKLDQELNLGTGADSFRAIDDGDIIDVTFGSQGGQHVWVSVQAVGIDPGEKRPLLADMKVPELVVELIDGEGRVIGELVTPDWIAWDGDVELAEMVGEELRFDVPSGVDVYDDAGEPTATPGTTPGVEPRDAEFVLSATLTDTCGTELTAERFITLGW